VNPVGLSSGSYTGSISATAPGCGSASLPVTVTVGPSQVLTLAPGSFAFTYQSGGAIPAAQTLSIGGRGLIFTVTTASAGGWLSVIPLSGAAPATLSVAVNPT